MLRRSTCRQPRPPRSVGPSGPRPAGARSAPGCGRVAFMAAAFPGRSAANAPEALAATSDDAHEHALGERRHGLAVTDLADRAHLATDLAVDPRAEVQRPVDRRRAAVAE